MVNHNHETDRDRAISAVSGAGPQRNIIGISALKPVVMGLRRAKARIVPVLRPDMTSRALQASLLDQVDVSGYNRMGPPTLRHLRSQVVSAAQIQEPLYEQIAARLGEVRRFHRKQWEFVAILAAAEQGSILAPGKRALGFGVGTEPLPAALASAALDVVATDQPIDQSGHWTTRNEHAQGLFSLYKPAIIDEATMRERVSFRPVDMNRIPNDLGEFDLIWSACALEHLGSPQAGLEFLHNTLRMLKPGGIAVHTTEFDLTPGATAVDYGHCALYRLEDIMQLQAQVRADGFEMDLNPYVAFEHPADRAIAPPMSVGDEEFHLKLALYDSITTSIVLLIRRPAM